MKILCLANSFKEGGRCLAGIQLNENNQPIFNANRPMWIRPVCNTEHGQVPTHLCANIAILDIIEIANANVNSTGYQSENTTFDENSLKIIGKLDKSILNELCDNKSFNVIFENRGKAVPEEAIGKIDHSLMLLKAFNFEVIEKEYEDREKPQIRLEFDYNSVSYDFPITDPVFLNDYKRKPQVLHHKDEIFVVVSLGVPFKEWYYKLVAAVIY